jgi:hypothetical protein
VLRKSLFQKPQPRKSGAGHCSPSCCNLDGTHCRATAGPRKDQKQTQPAFLLAYHSHTLTRHNPAGNGRNKPPWECSMHPAAPAQQHSRRPHAVRAPQLTSGSKGKPADGCTLLATHCPSPSRSALQCSRRDATAAKMEPGAPKTTLLPLREAQTQYASIVDRCTILQGTGGSTLSCQHAIYPQAASPTWAHTISMRDCSNKWISSNSSSSRTLGWASPSTTQPHHSHTKMSRIPLSHMHT